MTATNGLHKILATRATGFHLAAAAKNFLAFSGKPLASRGRG
jgi:hypothetical protein